MASKALSGVSDQMAQHLEIDEQLALIRDLESRHEDLFRKLEELEHRVAEVLTQWAKPLSRGDASSSLAEQVAPQSKN
ncbi:MAG TPA: hypothetical protein PKI05_08220 [Thermogutta sp.]|nr:hypothetical protein [Thermogutta sp.]